MKIVFLHGKLSSPNSLKAQWLREMGHDVVAPKLPKSDWQRSLRKAKKAIRDHKPDIVVGSSRGGALALASAGSVPAILLAPAWKKFSPLSSANSKSLILHS